MIKVVFFFLKTQNSFNSIKLIVNSGGKKLLLFFFFLFFFFHFQFALPISPMKWGQHNKNDNNNKLFALLTRRKKMQAFSEISGIITMFYVVRALSPYTDYEFYVIAVNNIGRGPPSIPATTTTGETGKNSLDFVLFYHLFGILL